MPEVRTAAGRTLTEVEAKRLLMAARGDRLESLVLTGLFLSCSDRSECRTNPPTGRRRALPKCRPHALVPVARHLHGAGLDLVWTGTDKVIKQRRGLPTARLSGLPGELLLFLFGRRDAADVQISGSPEAVEVLQRTSFGI